MKRLIVPALVAAAALALTGCANDTTASPVPAKTGTPQPSKTPSITPSPTETAWNSFSTEDGYFSFKYPADWTVEASYPEPAFEDQKAVDIRVNDAKGQTVANLSSGGLGFGSPCGTPYPFTALDTAEMNLPHDTVTASSEATTPRFQFSAIEYPSGVSASMGIINFINPTEACQFWNVYASPKSDPHYYVSFADQIKGGVEGASTPLVPTFANLDEARAFMETDNYKKLKTLFTSLTVTEN